MSQQLEENKEYALRQSRYIVRQVEKLKKGKIERITLCLEGDKEAFQLFIQNLKLYTSRNDVKVETPRDRRKHHRPKLTGADENTIYIYYASEINEEDAYWYLNYHPGSIIILLDKELPVECKKISLLK